MNVFKSLLMLAAIFGGVQILYATRTRAMRALSVKWGFRYVGPTAKLYWPVTHPIARPPVPSWVSRLTLSGFHISRIWNVVEGEKEGMKILIFDAILGDGRGSHPCTLIACETEVHPFQDVASVDRVLQMHGWSILHGVWFLWFSWTMRVSRIDGHLKRLYLN